MLPEADLDVRLDEGRLRPRYLGEGDRPWVEALLDVLDAAVGQPRARVVARLEAAEPPAPRAAARRAMTRLLLDRHGFAVDAPVAPERIRAEVFERAAWREGRDRSGVVDEAAEALGLAAEDLDRALYADRPDRRVLRPAREPISPDEALARYNLQLAQALLFRAEHLSVALRAGAKQVLRHARLQRLLLRAHAPETACGPVRLELSGPLSLFRRTTKYGRAMATWLPALTRLGGWSLEARCVLRAGRGTFVADHRDPLGTTHVPARRFDSKVERCFFRDLGRLDTGWEVRREGDAVAVGGRLLCPDFTLVDRGRELRVPVEIVGFWTPGYLRDKLATVRALPPARPWLLCVDVELATTDEGAALPEHAPVLWYRRRIDVRRLVELVEAHATPSGPWTRRRELP